MNWVDIVIIIYLLLSVVVGIAQGLIRSLFSIIGLIVGIVLAARFYQQLGNLLTFIHNSDVANIVAFVFILLATMGVAALIALALRSILKAIMLGWIDRLGGAILGLILGALSVSAFLAIIVKFTDSPLITNSALAGFFLNKFPIIMGFLPSEFKGISNFFK
jgi:membrane protein required for colicin V production